MLQLMETRGVRIRRVNWLCSWLKKTKNKTLTMASEGDGGRGASGVGSGGDSGREEALQDLVRPETTSGRTPCHQFQRETANDLTNTSRQPIPGTILKNRSNGRTFMSATQFSTIGATKISSATFSCFGENQLNAGLCFFLNLRFLNTLTTGVFYPSHQTRPQYFANRFLIPPATYNLGQPLSRNVEKSRPAIESLNKASNRVASHRGWAVRLLEVQQGRPHCLILQNESLWKGKSAGEKNPSFFSKNNDRPTLKSEDHSFKNCLN